MVKRPTPAEIRAAEAMRRRFIVQEFVGKLFKLKWWIAVPLGLIVAGLVGGLLVLHFANSSSSNEAELKSVRGKISRHYILPKNEVPALATVTDKTKLKAPIFQKAENGDKILIYQQNKVAIIYRPKLDRIVATGPVAIDPPPSGGKQ